MTKKKSGKLGQVNFFNSDVTNITKPKPNKKHHGHNSANQFEKWFKRCSPYTHAQAKQILISYQHWEQSMKHRKSTNAKTIHHVPHHRIKTAIFQLYSHKKGHYSKSIVSISKQNKVGRTTLWRYYKKWLANTDPKYRAYYSNLFTNHDPKQKKNQHH